MTEQTILVTGAANGLGRAISKLLANQPGNLILLDKDSRNLESLYDEITALNIAKPAIYPMNLAGASIEDFQTLGNTIEREYKNLNSLIHCAVHFIGLTPFSQIKPLDWFESIQTNINATYLLTQSCQGLLQAASSANLIFITDDFTKATATHAYRGAYAVSKSAIDTLMKVVAEETEELPDFKTFCFNPGLIETRFLAKIYPTIPENKLPAIEVIARECLDLSAKEKAEVHGKIINASQACFYLQL